MVFGIVWPRCRIRVAVVSEQILETPLVVAETRCAKYFWDLCGFSIAVRRNSCIMNAVENETQT